MAAAIISHVAADDERVARALRELRRRKGQTQGQAAAAAGVTVKLLRRVERTPDGSVPVEALRRIFAAYEASVRLSVWWKGADLDRILDEGHAAIVERVVELLDARGWLTAPEVTFSEFGERGSIDILAFHPASGCGLVIEIKTAFGSLEETNRVLDVKVRLAPKLVAQRFGSRPASVSRLLVLPEDMSLRRVAARHARTLAAVYPVRGRDVRAWLRSPAGSISGLWFLSNGTESASRDRAGTPSEAQVPSNGRRAVPYEEGRGQVATKSRTRGP